MSFKSINRTVGQPLYRADRLYSRDAAWTKRSGRPNSVPTRYHVPSVADPARAACSRRIVLDEDSEIEANQMVILHCAKPACAERIAALQPPSVRLAIAILDGSAFMYTSSFEDGQAIAERLARAVLDETK